MSILTRKMGDRYDLTKRFSARLYTACELHTLLMFPKHLMQWRSLLTFHEFGMAEFIVNNRFSPAATARGGNRDLWPHEAVMIR
ncbi:unnamed protein product [Clonostachys solani]|uniref:Uncharacterized protein n=1 Tax=Clonostachys solani TaxID=160281 RepID=A0A9N9ZNU4_9HYPO|nr:unnamed protein product [Clonostachys solani]